VERLLIEVVLERAGGNQVKAADMLGINRNTLRKKITELRSHSSRRRLAR
jgi:two-component system nitrogen regulation response regulator GlnG